MIDPKLFQLLARFNDVLMPKCRNEIHSIYEDLRQLDIRRQGRSSVSKAGKIKEGVFKDVTLYPVLSPKQQNKVVASFEVANRRILLKIRATLKPYAMQLKKLQHSKLQSMNQVFGSINNRLKRMSARYRRYK